MKKSAFEDFSESAQETLDFARCQRPDGSYYGTGGQCRKGTPVGPREIKAIAKKAKDGDAKAKKALEKMASDGDKDAKKALKAMGGAAPKEEAKELTDMDGDKLVEAYKKIDDVDDVEGYDDAEVAVDAAKDAIREDDRYLENDMEEAMASLEQFKDDNFYRQDEAIDILEEAGVAPDEVAKLREQYDEMSNEVNQMTYQQEDWAGTMGGTDKSYDDDAIIGMMQGGWANQSGTYDEEAVIQYGQNLATKAGVKVDEGGARELAMIALDDAGVMSYKPGAEAFRRDDIREPNPFFSNEERLDRYSGQKDKMTAKIKELAEGTDAEGLL